MEFFENSIDKLKNFYNIEKSGAFGENIFKILKDIIPFDSGYIFYTNPNTLQYAYNPKTNNIDEIKQPFLEGELRFKEANFGKIIITGNFSEKQKKVFQTCICIISNIIKDKEISKIMNLQAIALQEGYSEIQKSEKLKTEFISNMSHELRTPLNSILGYSDLLSNKFVGPLNKKQKEYLNDIKVASLHLLGMVNEILDISKLESGATQINKTEFEISVAIKEVTNIIQPLLINKNQKLKTKINNQLITADYQKFQQILFNLLNNAIKYTPNNGEINIITSKNNSHLTITIKDNGIGIAKVNQEKIFEKFTQIGNEKNSTGLGLTITKKLIELHNWEISLNSQENIGSEFYITIPFD